MASESVAIQREIEARRDALSRRIEGLSSRVSTDARSLATETRNAVPFQAEVPELVRAHPVTSVLGAFAAGIMLGRGRVGSAVTNVVGKGAQAAVGGATAAAVGTGSAAGSASGVALSRLGKELLDAFHTTGGVRTGTEPGSSGAESPGRRPA